MARTLKSQLVPPRYPGAFSGTWSPIFQPKRWASLRPITMPWRSARKSCHSPSGTLNSGYIRCQSSGTITNCAKKFFGSW